MASVTGIAEAKNADIIKALRAMLTDAETGVVVGFLGVVQLADGAVLQVVDGDIIDSVSIVGQLQVMALQQAMIEAAQNLEDADEEGD